jgi:hypothetical protein
MSIRWPPDIGPRCDDNERIIGRPTSEAVAGSDANTPSVNSARIVMIRGRGRSFRQRSIDVTSNPGTFL